MEENRKNSYLLVVVDAFSKIMWIHPTRSRTAEQTLNRLSKQAGVLENPSSIVTDLHSRHTFSKNIVGLNKLLIYK